ncbi:hypothetical protein D3C81_2271660 [compost metagenome]
MQQQDRLDDHEKRLRIDGEQIANLQVRMKAVEQRQSDDHDGLLSAAVSNAAALIALQTLVVQQIHGA